MELLVAIHKYQLDGILKKYNEKLNELLYFRFFSKSSYTSSSALQTPTGYIIFVTTTMPHSVWHHRITNASPSCGRLGAEEAWKEMRFLLHTA